MSGLAILALITHSQSRVWQSDRTLWQDAVRQSPLKPRPWINLGHAWMADGDEGHAAVAFAYAERLSANPRRSPTERAAGMALAELNLADVAWRHRDERTACLHVQYARQSAPSLARVQAVWLSWHCAR